MEILISVLAIGAVIVVLYILFKLFKIITNLIIIGVFLLAAYITNPSLEKHIIAVKQKAEKKNITVREKHISIKDLKVASLTQITINDETKVVGIGGFTQVFVFRVPEK